MLEFLPVSNNHYRISEFYSTSAQSGRKEVLLKETLAGISLRFSVVLLNSVFSLCVYGPLLAIRVLSALSKHDMALTRVSLSVFMP